MIPVSLDTFTLPFPTRLVMRSSKVVLACTAVAGFVKNSTCPVAEIVGRGSVVHTTAIVHDKNTPPLDLPPPVAGPRSFSLSSLLAFSVVCSSYSSFRVTPVPPGDKTVRRFDYPPPSLPPATTYHSSSEAPLGMTLSLFTVCCCETDQNQV